MYLLSNMVILGIYVSFWGCIVQVAGTCQFQRAKKSTEPPCRSAQKMDEESREHPKPEPLEWNLPRDIGSPAMNGARDFHVFSYEMRSVEGNPKKPQNQRVGLKLVLQILDTEHQLCLDLIRHLCWLPWGTLQKRSILVKKGPERRWSAKAPKRKVIELDQPPKKMTPLLTTWSNHIWIHEL